MNSLDTEDQESTDISDALINEAARLENEFRDQETEKSDTAPVDAVGETENVDETVNETENLSGTVGETKNLSETVRETENLDCIKKNEPLENLSPPTVESNKMSDSPTKSSPSKSTDHKPVKSVSIPEKRKAGNSSLKRKSLEDSLESLRPQPPDPKRLKKGFKIPKLSKQGSSTTKSSTGLTEEQKQFLAELERDFSQRYTEEDEDYVKATNTRFSPPLVEDFYCPPKRHFNRSEGSSHYDRNNRNSSPHGHSHRHSHHQKYPRDYSNNRDYPNSRDHSSSRDHSNSRYHHQRHQQRYQPY